MAPTRLLLLAALAGAASATLVCPTSSQDPNSACLCTSGCSINGDTTFPWSLPAYPPPALPMGMDTICATIIVPCTPAFATVNAVLGVTGNVQMDANATCVPCDAPHPRRRTRRGLGPRRAHLALSLTRATRPAATTCRCAAPTRRW